MKNPISIIYHIIMFLLFTIIGIAQSEYDPQNIIDKTIEKYGGTAYKNALIEFDFRDRHYKVFRKNGNFLYDSTLIHLETFTKDLIINQYLK